MDQFHVELGRHLEDPCIPIEFAENDPLEACIGDHLEAAPAGRRGHIDGCALDSGAVRGCLDHRVGLGVDGSDAVAVFHHVVGLIAVGHAANAAVVAGGEDDLVANDQGAHVLAAASGARGHLTGDVHEVVIPGHARRAHGRPI